MRKPKITEAEARAIVQSYMDADAQKKLREDRQYLGRYFKYRNSYGDGERWWLYYRVDAVPRHEMRGLQFEKTSRGNYEIEPSGRNWSYPGNGWIEIGQREFRSALVRFRRGLLKVVA